MQILGHQHLAWSPGRPRGTGPPTGPTPRVMVDGSRALASGARGYRRGVQDVRVVFVGVSRAFLLGVLPVGLAGGFFLTAALPSGRRGWPQALVLPILWIAGSDCLHG